MAINVPFDVTQIAAAEAARGGWWGVIKDFIRRSPLGAAGAAVVILLMLVALSANLIEATLSFLGLGVQEPTAAWGLMLRGAAVDFAESAPWMAVFPGLAISLAVFAFNLFGDSLRDALDPKLRTL